jgi:hypothetical protein
MEIRNQSIYSNYFNIKIEGLVMDINDKVQILRIKTNKFGNYFGYHLNKIVKEDK